MKEYVFDRDNNNNVAVADFVSLGLLTNIIPCDGCCINDGLICGL